MRFLARTPTPRDVVRAELATRVAEHGRPGGGLRWAAIEKSSGTWIGWFALDRPSGLAADEVELGYRLVAAAWGNGYATEGARALLALAFDELGVRRVVAQTMFVNAASRQVLEKIGLTHSRTFHESFDDPVEGTEFGEVEYEIDRDVWRGGSA